MAENNFFNLNLKHKVVKDFNDDHQKSIKLFRESYAFLNQFDYDSPADKQYETGVEFYRGINRTHALMQETFNNLFISYYAFRKAAQDNPEIMEEFKKMPADFSFIQQQFSDMIKGYETALKGMKEIL